MTLRAFLTDKKTGLPKRGAMSRAAEHLGVSLNCVKRWYNGTWPISPDAAARIQDMIHARINLDARKSFGGGRPRKPRNANVLQSK